MPFVIKNALRENNYYRMSTAIGPCFTDDLIEAARFHSRRAAERQRLAHWAFLATDVVDIEAEDVLA